jgi:NADPH2:quinone reductase
MRVNDAPMRAVVVERFGDPEVLEVREIAAPAPAEGEVAIDVAYAGVNYAEVMGRRGSMRYYEPPFVPGLEVSGTVRALGRGVEGLSVGQPVAALTTRGGYAEVATAPATRTFALPAEVDLRAAAAFPVLGPTAWALVHESARLRTGDTVLVHAAAGGVGTVLAPIAKAAGVAKLLGVVSTPEKAEYATRFGYDEVFLSDEWEEGARAALGGRGLDVIFDSIGGQTRARGLELLAPLGRLVLYGNATDEPERGVPESVLRREVKGIVGFSTVALAERDPVRARAISDAALNAFARGDLPIDVTEVLPLADAPRAHVLLEGRTSTGKLLLAVGESGD